MKSDSDPFLSSSHIGRAPASWASQLEADAALVAKLGLSNARLAKQLRIFRDTAKTGLGQSVRVPPHFEAEMDDTRGRLPCPFGDAGAFAKLNTTIRNLATGETLVLSDLSLHLMELHGWFGDPGSPFRLDPGTLARILEISTP